MTDANGFGVGAKPTGDFRVRFIGDDRGDAHFLAVQAIVREVQGESKFRAVGGWLANADIGDGAGRAADAGLRLDENRRLGAKSCQSEMGGEPGKNATIKPFHAMRKQHKMRV